MVSEVAERISSMILSGQLRSGDRLKSDEIASRP
jgi:DNA-binding GntR family transcriptional regulator